MTFSGLDPTDVTRAADSLARQASALEAVTGRVDALIRTAMHHWSGPEARDFHQWWVGQHRPRLVEVGRVLHGAATVLRRQVSEQEHASGAVGAGVGVAASALECRAPTAHEFLELSRHAYDSRQTSFESADHMWTPVTDAELRRIGVDPRSMNDPVTGFGATLYRSDDGTYVLSFAGTASLVDLRDVANDIEGAGGVSAQSLEAIRLAKVLDAHLEAPLSFTGHSLGGRLAALSAIATGGSATTFNAAGVSDQEFALALAANGRDPHVMENVAKSVLMRAPLVGPFSDGPDLYATERLELQDRVTAYHGGADPLTITQDSTSAPNAVGRQVYVDSHGKTWIDAHDIDGLAAGLPT